ncbi:Protein ZBED8 [Lamellibrachia satsuma]|nr:Protein ZBED8 [Lamellibrachia satsuma]
MGRLLDGFIKTLLNNSIFDTRETENEVRILFVGDPQIIGLHDTSFMVQLPIYDSDRYLAKTFRYAFNHVQPDVIIFLGDLIDEGSSANNAEYDIYVQRFHQIFSTSTSHVKHVYLPGDNDVGGEDTDERTEFKVNRFKDYFGNDKLVKIKFIDLFTFNYNVGDAVDAKMAAHLKNLNAVSTAPFRIILNHINFLKNTRPEFHQTLQASYRICYLLAQHQVPFAHAELFKKAFMASAKVLFAGFQNKDKIVQQTGKLHLSPDTCACRCDELSGDILTQLMTKLRACPAFSLALDESIDKSDMAQLMVSVRYFNEGVSEDFLCLIPLKGTTTARDVCSTLLKFCEENDLTWKHLVSLCTDGAPIMLGRQAGFVVLFHQEIGKPNLISYHCIIHQQAVCAKAGCCLQDTMKTVVESVNLIRARSLIHRRFQNHSAALDDAEFGDVLFYNSVHWLSRGAFLERFAALLPHIVSFLKEIDQAVAHLEDDKFRVRLCVLTDIFGHLNKLNMLKGRHKLLHNLYETVKSFEDKVTLFKVHAEGGNFLHFKFTREFFGEDGERIADAKRALADLIVSTNASLVMSGDTHKAKMYICRNCRNPDKSNFVWEGDRVVMKSDVTYTINLHDSHLLHEIVVPTCSYRMGVSNMGYGAAVIDRSGEMHYVVLSSPSRYLQLSAYGTLIIVLLLLALVKLPVCSMENILPKPVFFGELNGKEQ